MNSPARTSAYKRPTLDYLGLSPKIRKSKRSPESSSSSSSSDSMLYTAAPGGSDVKAVEEPELYDLDETLVYEFQDGQAVWVKIEEDEWVRGQVSGKKTRTAHTRVTYGKFYPVIYGRAGRKYFSPLNGDIKPDTARMRELLEEGGWL